jgi:hypothetical protein
MKEKPKPPKNFPIHYIEIHCLIGGGKKNDIYVLTIMLGKREFIEENYQGSKNAVLQVARHLSKVLNLPIYETHPTLTLVEIK